MGVRGRSSRYKRWTDEELVLVNLALDNGRKAREILHLFPGRTGQDVRNALNVHRKKRLGLCHCGRNPLPEDFSACAECRDREKERREGRAKQGICVMCGENPVETLTLCTGCLEKRRSYYPKKKPNSRRNPGPGMVRWLACNNPGSFTSRLPRDRKPGLFVDLFGGSGAFALQMQEDGWDVVYNDINPRLVQYMRTMQGHPVEVIDLATQLGEQIEPPALHWLYDNPSFGKPVLQAAVFLLMAHNVEGRNMRGRNLPEVLPLSKETHRRLTRKAERLAEVTILNSDFAEVLRRYDGPDTLFFADPPWIGGEDLYEFHIQGRFEELSNLLLGCRGRYAWTMSSNREAAEIMCAHPHMHWWISRQTGMTFRQLLASNFRPLVGEEIDPERFGLRAAG